MFTTRTNLSLGYADPGNSFYMLQLPCSRAHFHDRMFSGSYPQSIRPWIAPVLRISFASAVSRTRRLGVDRDIPYRTTNSAIVSSEAAYPPPALRTLREPIVKADWELQFGVLDCNEFVCARAPLM